MGAQWGQHYQLTIFGESHGPAIGIVIDGIPPGVALNEEQIKLALERRRPGYTSISTKRKESDAYEILSGYFAGHTTGTPLMALIKNTDQRSRDYSKIKQLMRPGHADYTAQLKYGGFQDYRGGGHFSGRLTAPLVFAGAIAAQLLACQGITIGARLQAIGQVQDEAVPLTHWSANILRSLKTKTLPTLNTDKAAEMQQAIQTAQAQNDSVGGVIECVAVGLPGGWGEPFFNSVESVISHLAFAIPGVKGIEFGSGFALSKMQGSQANDCYYYEGTQVKTKTNHCGGVLGGITNGMPLVFRVSFKPTSSIARPQPTINIKTKTAATLAVTGRHDPCIVPRALPVVEAVCAIALLELAMSNVTYNCK